jgi:hypothetical protein
VTATHALDRLTTLPDDEAPVATGVALEEHGFSVEIVDDLDAARDAVLVLPCPCEAAVRPLHTGTCASPERPADAPA